jgi:hypothetical protein
VRVFRAAGPQAGLHLSAIDQPFGEIPSGGNQEGWKIKRPRGQRVLDGLSGARAGGCVLAASNSFNLDNFKRDAFNSQALNTASLENEI